MPVDERGVYHNPICDKSILAFKELFEVLDEIELRKLQLARLKAEVKRIQEELKKEYGEGYIKRKKVRNYRYPVFRSLEKGKDYNLERNFPEYAKTVMEYYAVKDRLKELNAVRKKLDRFIDTAYVMCVPPEDRNPKKAYKARQWLKDIAFLAEVEDGLREQCEEGDEEACKNLKEFEECGEFYVDSRKKIVRCADKEEE